MGVSLLGLAAFVAALSVALQLLFFAYFVRHLAFAAAALQSAPADMAAPLVATGWQLRVSVLVACKNEETVIERLVSSLRLLDYPAHLLQVIVVDDGSLDRTGEMLESLSAGYPSLMCLHRPPGAGGGKSGALNAALPLVDGEVIVVFDADHRPSPDVVQRLARHFEDPGVGAVQGRCEISNAQDSPLARMIAIDYLAGYLVNEYARQSLFRLPAYGGANCAVRASALRDLGGWNVASVTEDTDLTLRLRLAGWVLRYDITALDAEEAVVTVGAYWRQRLRWARGHQQVWRDYHQAVWRTSKLGLSQKLETTMFLLVFHVPVFSALGLVVLGLWLTSVVVPPNPYWLFLLWTLLFMGPLLELGAGLLIRQSARREAFGLIFFLPLFLITITLCTAAWFGGVVARPSVWVKTLRAGQGVAWGAQG